MRNGERFHRDIANLKRRPGGKQPAGETGLELEFRRFLGGPVAIDRDLQFGAHRSETHDVVGMLMRDEHAVKAFRGAPDGCEPLPNLTQAESRVDKNAGFVRFQVGAIPGGTTAKDGQAYWHCRNLNSRSEGGNVFATGDFYLKETTGRRRYRRMKAALAGVHLFCL